MLVDATHVVMTAREFKDLGEYSCSIPTGQTIGKRWKCSDVYDPRRDRAKPLKWIMREYANHADPELIAIINREILIVEDGDVVPAEAARLRGGGK